MNELPIGTVLTITDIVRDGKGQFLVLEDGKGQSWAVSGIELLSVPPK